MDEAEALKMSAQIFYDTKADKSFRPSWVVNRFIIYGVLIIWAIIFLFLIYEMFDSKILCI